MKSLHILFVLLFISSATCDNEPVLTWEVQPLDSVASIRGISVVDAQTAWLSGSEGTIARTIDGGKNWEIIEAPVDSLDYRDIEAFSADEAMIMSIGNGESSRVYKTMNGGISWKLVHQNHFEEGFYDGFAFWDDRHGILMGDPIDGHLFILATEDGGESWVRIDTSAIPALHDSEYGFAASGSHISVYGDNNAWIATGGSFARVFYSLDKGKSWQVSETPVIHGSSSTGIFSLDFETPEYGIAVGGDYTKEAEGFDNVAITEDGGLIWKLVNVSQVDYRSSVRFVDDMVLVTGPSGSNYSMDKGKTWKIFGDMGFHTLDAGKDGKHSVWAAGSEGRVAKLIVQ